MSVQIFVDESKRREFVMAAVSVRADHVGAYRRELRKQLRPGARRFHCTGVSDSDRSDFIAAVGQWPAVIDIFVSHSQNESEARRQCIRAVAIHAAETMAGRLVIEADESHNRSDRHQLTQVLRERSSSVRWDLASPYSEELLWVPDTAAWCWPHPKPQWRNLISPLIRSVTHL